MATRPVQVDTADERNSVKQTKKRSLTEANGRWDDVRDVADIVRGGHRAKSEDGKSESERRDPELVEFLARLDLQHARFPAFMAEMRRRQEKFLLGIIPDAGSYEYEEWSL